MALHEVVVYASAIAIIILFTVFLTHVGLTDGFYHNRKPHPARISFLHMCTAEITALLLLLIANELTSNTESCRAIGMGLHLMCLVSSLWICLINIDLWTQTKLALEATAIVPTRAISVEPKVVSTRVRVCLTCVSWGVPALIVLIEGLSDDGVCDSTLDGSVYGGSGFCWISDSTSLVAGFVVPVLLSAMIGLGVTAHWYVLTSAAYISKRHPPKLLDRIDRDQKCATFTLISGVTAFMCLAFVPTPNPDEYLALQMIFSVVILLHALGMLVGFVVIPATAKKAGTWGVGAGASFPISPDGSLASLSIAGSQSNLRGPKMFVPGHHNKHIAMNPAADMMQRQNNMRRKTVLATQRKERQNIVDVYQLNLDEVVRFSRDLVTSEPEGVIAPQMLKNVWLKSFPEKATLGDGFVTKVFQVFDWVRSGHIDHNQLSIELAIGSARTVGGRLDALFSLLDTTQRGSITIESVFQAVVKITQLRDADMTQDVADVLRLELLGVFDDKERLNRAEFVAIQDSPNAFAQLLDDALLES